jgi:type I restriction enzyme R subunit
LLEDAGWKVQDIDQLNLGASRGIAVREFPLTSGHADYLLLVDRKAFGVVEAKPHGTTLSGVAEQSQAYISGIPANIPSVQIPLPFAYESTGIETFFRDVRDPDPRSRRVFSFHKPETLCEWISQSDTLRSRIREIEKLSPLTETGLRSCQIEAIKNLEKSFAQMRQRSLIQMATGSGKTYTAVSFIYRLIKFANAKRVLFLVDRSNLGRQTKKEFEQYVTPDDGRKFTELYNVQRMTSNTLDPVNRVVITTIQRLYSMLSGKSDFDEENEEVSLFNLSPEQEKPKEVSYNRDIPIETFDFIVTDECHRSIYHLWRQVLEYFDASLTATPSKQTLGFFHNNLVMEYSHERAVADGVNVGYEVYRIQTEITEKGSKVEAGNWVDKRNRLTRKLRWEQLDEDLEYKPTQLDRVVVAKDQIRTIIKTFRDRLFTEIFPGRTEIPKTLVFAKDDSHAEDIVEIIREEFGKGNDFCKKITYRTTGDKPEDLIASFRNSYNPRIAVTVDMISTGTDIKPLECLLFMRVYSMRVY